MKLASGARFAVLSLLCVMALALSMGFALSSAAIHRAPLVIWAISLAGALTLYVVLCPLVRRVYGRQVREEALQAHAAELDAQVTARTRVELPAGAPSTGEADHQTGTAPAPSRGKAILVVDDEPDVAELLAATLLLDGHHVDAVNSGAAALNRLLDRDYDLVFSDMKMPGMSGAQLYDEVARRRPGLERRIVFVTGDLFNPTTQQFFDRTRAVCVSKPFDVDHIRRLVPRYANRPDADLEPAAIALRS